MGLAFVLLFYLVALSLAAIITAGVLGGATYVYLKRDAKRRTRMVILAAISPFLCLAYAGVWFIGYAVINDLVFHHDPSLGDGWYTDIGNGYAIDFIDVTDQGTVHPIRGEDRGLNDRDAVDGVRRLQIAGPCIFGSQDRDYFSHLGQESNAETNFFSIDTASHKVTQFPTEAALASFARQNGTTLTLRPIYDVYSQFRFSWFEPVAGLALVLPPGIAFAWVIRRIHRIRKEGSIAAAA